jgi:hypothetical protein
MGVQSIKIIKNILETGNKCYRKFKKSDGEFGYGNLFEEIAINESKK